MLIIPAIDLRGGKVVRLTQGKFNHQKIYSKDPLKVAKHWARAGAKLLHIVDLDGAATGKPKNLRVAKEIISRAGMPVEFGGGVREVKIIDELVKLGAERVVLGTKAVIDRAFLNKVFKKFGNRIIVSIDARQDKVLINGWQKGGFKAKGVLEFAKELKKIGFKQVIYTDVAKDGMLSGPNIKAIKELAKESGLSVIASGGISSLDDLRRLKRLEKQGVAGVIVGKALYEGKFTLREALKLT